MIAPASAPKKIKIPIKVVAGAGSSPFQVTGYILRVVISPVDNDDSYLWSMSDGDGDGVDGVNAPVTGPQTMNVNYPVIGLNSFNISGATSDGQYVVSIYFEDKSR